MTYLVVSLFSGAGFLDFGFTENGFDIIWGCELIPYFANTHNYNLRLRYGESKAHTIYTDDITKVKAQDIPKATGIIGGPPCQDFSVGNANKPGVSGERGKLVWDYLKKVAAIEPDFFLFENVEGLFKIKRHREEALLPLLEQFDALGYKVYYSVLNALDYGIPQDRSRLFIVAFKKHIIDTLKRKGFPGFNWPKPKYPDAKKLFEWPDTWDFGIKIDEETIINNLPYPYELTVHSVIGNESELENLPNHVFFRPYSDKFHTIPEGDDRRKSFKRLHRFRYSPTVAYGNNEVHLHPTQPRRLSVREALRIQSVPDWYQFEQDTPLDKMFKMVSNGVPFRLALLLSKQIKTVLDTYQLIQNEMFSSVIKISNTSEDLSTVG